jgi:hypothetical protein
MLSKTEIELREKLKQTLYDTNVFSPEYIEILDQMYLLNYKERNDEEFTNYYKCSKQSKFNARSSVDPDWADAIEGEI